MNAPLTLQEAEMDRTIQLIRDLRSLADGDPESTHMQADQLLLAFINDPEVTEAFDSVSKWYA